MTITDMNNVIATGTLKMGNASYLVGRLRARCQQRVNILRNSYPDLAKEVPRVREDLKRLGVTPGTVYLYIHYHHLLDKVVEPLVKNVCDSLIKEREREIHNQAQHHTQMNNEMSCYTNSLENISSMLKKNTGYIGSPVFQQIIRQFEEVFERNPLM